MINFNSHRLFYKNAQSRKNFTISNLIESRNLFNVQSCEYQATSVSSLDLDPTSNFLLAGLSNRYVRLFGIRDPGLGTLEEISRIDINSSGCLRVQWNPGEEQFFSFLDQHNLYLVDPVESRAVDKFTFEEIANWSEWNPNDRKMISVCNNNSYVRLVDIRIGTSAQIITLGAMSGLTLNHRATRCLWSKYDLTCLFVGDNEGYIHVYDTRYSTRPQLLVGEERGQISGMSFTNDNNSIITSQGSQNRLIQWDYDRCSLKAWPNKFRKRKKIGVMDVDEPMNDNMQALIQHNPRYPSTSSVYNPGLSRRYAKRLHRQIEYMPFQSYNTCQFYVSDRHVYCPVPVAYASKSNELYIYDIQSGYRVKTLKSDAILSKGVFSVVGLLPESIVLYVGCRGRLNVWSIDEDHQRKMNETVVQYHQDNWDSDND